MGEASREVLWIPKGLRVWWIVKSLACIHLGLDLAIYGVTAY